MKPLILVLLISTSLNVFSDMELVKGATVTAIANTNNNEAKFTIWVSGGTGPCASSSITFPASASRPEVYERAYATALMAYATGDVISAHDYYSDKCYNAAYIRVSKQ